MRATSSGVSRRPVPRASRWRNSPPLMPIRRWMRHTESSMPPCSSASRQARTCWYTLSTSVPSRSNRNASPRRCRDVMSTLPRSVLRKQQHLSGGLASLERAMRLGRLRQRELVGDAELELAALDPAQHLARPLQQDRKSTRLNSSHVRISYAVFCLKKKMTTKKKWLQG